MRLGDREIPVPPPLQAVHLVVTPDQLLNARGNKAIGFLPMHPLEIDDFKRRSSGRDRHTRA